MNRTLVVEPEAEAEIARAAAWYDLRNPSVRVGFLQAVDRALAFIRENPSQYQIVYRNTRRAVLRRYPYALLYIASDSEVIVVACLDTRRAPEHLEGRAK
jgi:plasmid stabilization system protein ParE